VAKGVEWQEVRRVNLVLDMNFIYEFHPSKFNMMGQRRIVINYLIYNLFDSEGIS